MARSGTKTNRYTRNAPGEQNIELDDSLRPMLINIMREQFPDIEAYKKGNLLNRPADPEPIPE